MIVVGMRQALPRACSVGGNINTGNGTFPSYTSSNATRCDGRKQRPDHHDSLALVTCRRPQTARVATERGIVILLCPTLSRPRNPRDLR